MGLEFRKLRSIPKYVYRLLTPPKTMEQCDYLIDQKQVELEAINKRLEDLGFQKELNKDDPEESDYLKDSMRSVCNARATLDYELILLNQWRKDFIIQEGISKKKEINVEYEIKSLRARVHELEQGLAQAKATKPLKSLACQVEQFVRIFTCFVFFNKSSVSPSQMLTIQRIAREIAEREPDPHFAEMMQPLIYKAKIEKENQKEMSIE